MKENSIQAFAFCSIFLRFLFQKCLYCKSIERRLGEWKRDSKRMSKRNRNFEKSYLCKNRNTANRKLLKKESSKRKRRKKEMNIHVTVPLFGCSHSVCFLTLHWNEINAGDVDFIVDRLDLLIMWQNGSHIKRIYV